MQQIPTKIMFRIPIASVVLIVLSACSGEQAAPPPLPIGNSALKVPLTTESQEARHAYLTGRDLLESLRPSEAFEWFDRATEADPEFALAHLMRARLAENPERFYRHLELAEASIEQVSAGEQLMIKAFRAGSQGWRDDQAQYLKKLVALYSGDERAHMALARYFIETRQYLLAQVQLERAISIVPDFAPAFNLLGYTLRGQGDFEGAKLVFQRYIELVPDQPNPYDSFAELLMEAGNYEESIAMYRRALEVDPNFGPSHYGIAINYSLLGQNERAVAAVGDMSAAARNVMERTKARQAERLVHLHAGDLDAALAVSDVMAKEAEETASFERLALARELAGDVLVFRGETDKALRSYQAAYDVRRESGISATRKQQARFQFLFKATLAALQSRRPLTAADYLEQYEQEIREAGSDYDKQRAFELNGIADILSGKYVEAVDNLKRADQFDPIVQYFLAVAHERAGNLRMARKHAENASFRNVLDPRLAYFRKPALEMFDRLDSQLSTGSQG